MNIIFYTITSITIGILVLIYAFLNIKKNKMYQSVLFFLCAIAYIAIGFIGQFVIPMDLSYITILIILFITIVLITLIYFMKRSEKR